MKTLYVTLATLFISALSIGQVWESNFDLWTNGTTPDGWFGSTTNMLEDSCVQTTGATQGLFLAELTNNGGPHRRFSTEGIALTEGQVYDVEVWAKGASGARVRTGLWDNDLDGFDFGYNGYNDYVEMTGGDVISFTQQITPDTTYSACEILISFIDGVVEIDRVEVRLGQLADPEPKTIAEIQTTMNADGVSPEAGVYVITQGTVTAVAVDSDNYGYFIQDGTGPWSGIHVRDFTNVPAIGDVVSVTGTVGEFFGNTRIDGVTAYMVTGSDAVPAPVVLGTAAVNAEMYEGVLVTTAGDCTTDLNQYNEWLISDGTGDVMIDDVMQGHDPTVGYTYEVTGPVIYSFESYRVEPRDDNDINVTVGLLELEQLQIATYPNPVSDELTITREKGEQIQMQMFDVNAKMVMDTIVTGTALTIDVSALPVGQYTMMFIDGASQATRQLQIVR